MKIPLFGGTGEDRFDDVSYQKTQNFYPHITKEGKSQLVLYPTPGLTLFADVGLGNIRGAIKYEGEYGVVSHNKFYRVTASGASVELGTLTTSSGRCSLAHNGANNGKQICIVDGATGYIFNSEYDTFAQIKLHLSGTATAGTSGTNLEDTANTFTADMVGQVIYNTTDSTQTTITAFIDADNVTVASAIFASGETFEVGTDSFPSTATHVQYMDTFFIVNNPEFSGRFNKSAGYDGTDWDGLEFATAERDSDELRSHVVANRQLWLVGDDTAEVWFNSGGADFPFEPVQSGFSQWGTAAPFSLVEISGIVFWLSKNDEGQGIIVMASGMQPVAISSPEIATEISKFTTIDDAYGWAYQYQQHAFYVLTFPSEEKTYVYDILTQKWHEWSSKNIGYHRGTTHTFVYGKHLVGDPVNGRIYELDWDANTDNGDTITRIRRSRLIHGDDKAIRHEAVMVDIKEGVGDTTTPDPQMLLRWRDSNGAWSNQHSRSMGKVGETSKKVIWRRLGRSRERVYEIMITDPVPAVLIEGYARVSPDSREIG